MLQGSSDGSADKTEWWVSCLERLLGMQSITSVTHCFRILSNCFILCTFVLTYCYQWMEVTTLFDADEVGHQLPSGVCKFLIIMERLEIEWNMPVQKKTKCRFVVVITIKFKTIWLDTTSIKSPVVITKLGTRVSRECFTVGSHIFHLRRTEHCHKMLLKFMSKSESGQINATNLRAWVNCKDSA